MLPISPSLDSFPLLFMATSELQNSIQNKESLQFVYVPGVMSEVDLVGGHRGRGRGRRHRHK